MAPTQQGRPRRARRSKSRLPALLLVLTLAGGYLAGDLYDVLPGPLTRSTDWPAAEPFPQAQLPGVAPAEDSAADLTLDPDAPVPEAAQVAALVNEFVANPNSGPGPGVLITDAATGDTLAESNAEVPTVPASTTKLLTGIAVLAAAGPQFQFRTTVVAGAAGAPAALTLVGSGDLTLAAGAGDPDATIGRGGLADLAADVAASLKAQGRTEVAYVAVDETLWTGPVLAQRWDDRDLAEGWIIPMSPIAINLGKLEGRMVRQQEPGLAAGRAFAAALAEHGITVSGDTRSEAAPENPVELAGVSSAPLGELVGFALVHSDNVLAESLGRLTAVATGNEASFAGMETAVIDALATLGVPTDGLRLADASGLSSVNQISPRMLVAALDALASGDHQELLAAVRGLPVAGIDGTLKTRMVGTTAAGTVAAKTGTLRSAATIAGQVQTADGRVLHVALMTHDLENSYENSRAVIDRLLVGLASCGC